MNFQYLNTKYNGAGDAESIKNLHQHYASRKAESLMDAMLAAIGISTLIDGNTINYDAITPQMEEAFSLSFPNKSISELEGLDAESLRGILSNWKGKLFEVQVRDQLNNGDIVGEVVLDQGQTAVLAESVNQPGWDLKILNTDGTADEFLQLKATESMSYINEALEKYPDIDIMATSEIASISEELQNSGISLDELNEPLLEVLDGGSDVLDMIVPGLPFLIIAAAEGRKVFVKKADWDEAVINIASRGVKTGLAMAVGLVAFDITGISWVGIGIAVLFRWGWKLLFGGDKSREVNKKLDVIIPAVKKQNEEMLLLKASYE